MQYAQHLSTILKGAVCRNTHSTAGWGQIVIIDTLDLGEDISHRILESFRLGKNSRSFPSTIAPCWMPAAIISMHSIQFHWKQWNCSGFSRTNRSSYFPDPGDTCTLLKWVMLFGLVWSSFYLALASSKDTNLPPEKPKGCVTKSTNLKK